MTLERTRKLIASRPTFGGYDRNSVRWIPPEIRREHGQSAVNRLIRELPLKPPFGRKPGTDFSKATR